MNTEQPLVFLGPRTGLCPMQVTHLEADINYTKVYTENGKPLLLSYTMKNVHAFLKNHGRFVRISRKHVVNLDYVKESNKRELQLENGLILCPSRRKRKELEQLFS